MFSLAPACNNLHRRVYPRHLDISLATHHGGKESAPDILDLQCNNVFKIPAIVGMAAMMVLFSLILYGNDGKIVFTEAITMGICLGILAVIGGIVYAVYRGTVKAMRMRLDI